ncbi:Hypothetical protein A7982_11757 [Minicystis rosea]|nr:Hypothetical protein A7982_11757 [Minicystis rosea]
MRDSDIPDSVRRFLRSHIDSVEQLEVLLLLRSASSHEWSVEEVNRALKSSETSIRDRLAVLVRHGFLTTREEGGHRLHRYQPAGAMETAAIDGLAAAYRERRLAVIDLIYAKPGSETAHFTDAAGRAKRDG